MEDCSKASHSYSVLGIPKSASLSDICKSYKSLVMKWHPDRNPSNKAEAEAKFRSINEAYRALTNKKREESYTCNGGSNKPKTPSRKKSFNHKRNNGGEELQISSPKLLSRTTSRIIPMRSPTFSRGASRRSMTPPPQVDLFTYFPGTASNGSTPASTTQHDPAFLSKASSRRSTTPIFFSQSAVRTKPKPIEKKLRCTLEELCIGCVKKIKITREVISVNGLFAQEEEMLMIIIKPGWRKGTKITFEGKGDERPGTLPADIIFIIDEKRHPIFKREGDDLELGVEVPLAQALTGCTVPVPLLGGGNINLSIEDIIYPGYEMRIPEQGMPKSKQEGSRGDLRLKFMVEFPSELSDEQRSEVVRILEECS